MATGNNRSLGRKSDGKFRATVDSATVIEKGDFLFYDTNDVKPASSQADQLSEGDNQGLLASRFAGISEGRSDNLDTDQILVDANRDREFEADAPSTTYEVGDLLGVDEAASGTALEDQKLAKVNSIDAAIAVCTRQELVAVAKVRYRLIRGGNLTERSRSKAPVVEVLAADRILTLADPEIISFDPAGARNIDLPPVAASAGRRFYISNEADAAEVMTIRLAGAGATVVTPTQNEAAILWCDGTSWRGLVGATS